MADDDIGASLSLSGARQRIAVVGTGISGLSAAWLLAQRHDVTVYEQAGRAGGHSCTLPTPDGRAVDIGFIVFNAPNYPNLTALLQHLGVASRPTRMSFAVSIDGGRLEYNGTDLGGLLAQPRNLLRPRFLRMVRDVLRFYRTAPGHIADLWDTLEPLGSYLDRNGYSQAFQHDHLLPMAAAIWSAPCAEMRDHPAAAFLRFCDNHGLLQVNDRPEWRTVSGGSQSYVARLAAPLGPRILTGHGVTGIARDEGGVTIRDVTGGSRRFDAVLIASHAPEALAMLDAPTPEERALLGAFRTSRNLVVLHTDASLMPRRKRAWASWNYLGTTGAPGTQDAAPPCVTYWMNNLQGIAGPDLFVTLNPPSPPCPGRVILSRHFDHPMFDIAAIEAQRRLWTLQGVRRTWFAGAWFGAGFHEDGLQAGLAAAEDIGGVRRPWSVPDESGRIHLAPAAHRRLPELTA